MIMVTARLENGAPVIKVEDQQVAPENLTSMFSRIRKKNPGKVEKKFVIRDSPAHIGVRRGEPDVVAWLNVFIYYHRKPGGELDALARKWFGEPLPIDPTL